MGKRKEQEPSSSEDRAQLSRRIESPPNVDGAPQGRIVDDTGTKGEFQIPRATGSPTSTMERPHPGSRETGPLLHFEQRVQRARLESQRIMDGAHAGAVPPGDAASSVKVSRTSIEKTRGGKRPMSSGTGVAERPRDRSDALADDIAKGLGRPKRRSEGTRQDVTTPSTDNVDERQHDSSVVEGANRKQRSGEFDGLMEEMEDESSSDEAIGSEEDDIVASVRRFQRPVLGSSAGGVTEPRRPVSSVLVDQRGWRIEDLGGLFRGECSIFQSSTTHRGDERAAEGSLSPYIPLFTAARHDFGVGLPPTLVDLRVNPSELSVGLDRILPAKSFGSHAEDSREAIRRATRAYDTKVEVQRRLNKVEEPHFSTRNDIIEFGEQAVQNAIITNGVNWGLQSDAVLFPKLRTVSTFDIHENFDFTNPKWYLRLVTTSPKKFFDFSSDTAVWDLAERELNDTFEGLLRLNDKRIFDKLRLATSDQTRDILEKGCGKELNGRDLDVLTSCITEAASMGYTSVGAYLLGSALAIYPDCIIAAALSTGILQQHVPLASAVEIIDRMLTGTEKHPLAKEDRWDETEIVFTVVSRTPLYTVYKIPSTCRMVQDQQRAKIECEDAASEFDYCTSPWSYYQEYEALENANRNRNVHVTVATLKPDVGPRAHNDGKKGRRYHFQDAVESVFAKFPACSHIVQWHSLKSLCTTGTIPHMLTAQFVDTIYHGRVDRAHDRIAASPSTPYHRLMKDPVYGPSHVRAFPPPHSRLGHAPPVPFLWLRYGYPIVLLKMHWYNQLTKVGAHVEDTVKPMRHIFPLMCWKTHHEIMMKPVAACYPIPPAIGLALDPSSPLDPDGHPTAQQLTNLVVIPLRDLVGVKALPKSDRLQFVLGAKRTHSSGEMHLRLARSFIPGLFRGTNSERKRKNIALSAVNSSVLTYLRAVTLQGIAAEGLTKIAEFRTTQQYQVPSTADDQLIQTMPLLRTRLAEAKHRRDTETVALLEAQVRSVEETMDKHGIVESFAVTVSNPRLERDTRVSVVNKAVRAIVKKQVSQALQAVRDSLQEDTWCSTALRVTLHASPFMEVGTIAPGEARCKPSGGGSEKTRKGNRRRANKRKRNAEAKAAGGAGAADRPATPQVDDDSEISSSDGEVPVEWANRAQELAEDTAMELLWSGQKAYPYTVLGMTLHAIHPDWINTRSRLLDCGFCNQAFTAGEMKNHLIDTHRQNKSLNTVIQDTMRFNARYEYKETINSMFADLRALPKPAGWSETWSNDDERLGRRRGDKSGLAGQK